MDIEPAASEDVNTTIDFCKSVTAKVEDSKFAKEFANNKAPLAMIAFAGIVVEKMMNTKKIN